MKVHAAIAEGLVEHGVETMFGVMGDGNMFIIDSYVREQSGRYVSAVNEAGAVLMALGYAGVSRRLGVSTVTHGPGLANTISSLVEATRERCPLLLVVGDMTSPRHAQYIDQRALVAPTGAGFEQVESPMTARRDLARAVRRATLERRPIVLNLPAEFNWEDAGEARVRVAPAEVQHIAPDPDILDAAVGIIATANRPIVVAGAGATDESCRQVVLRLADRIGAPVATTLAAKGLFTGHPDNLGVFGMLSTLRTVDVISSSDCVIAIGGSLNRWTGGGRGAPYLRDKRVVHCDSDAAAIGEHNLVDVGVVADASAFAAAVIEWLDEAEVEPTGFREQVRSKPDSDVEPVRKDGVEGCVDFASALFELNRALPAERTVAFDGGRFVGEALKFLDVHRPQSWLYPWRGFGAIGVGVATAIGGACADISTPAVAVVGDGGLMLYGLTEFNTAVRHGIDLIVVVCNDGSYGAEYATLRDRQIDGGLSMFEWPDFASVAHSLGGSGFTVRSSSDLDQLEKVIAERTGPLLIDIKLDPTEIPDLPR